MITPSDQSIVDDVYKITKSVRNLLDTYDIDYSAIGGTLLGMRRHGGLIPWDDDSDFIIVDEGADKLEEILFKLGWEWEDLRCTFEWGTFMFSLRDREVHAAWENVSYPYCDVLPMVRNGDRYEYRFSEIRRTFPNDFIYVEEWENRRKWDFGGLDLIGLSQAGSDRYLADAYGKNWNDEAYLTFDKVECKPIAREVHALPSRSPALPSEGVI